MALIKRKIRYEIIGILEVKLISFFLIENVAKKTYFEKWVVFDENNNWYSKQKDFDEKIDNNRENIIIINIKLILLSLLNILVSNPILS